jgi:hypothetical protein
VSVPFIIIGLLHLSSEQAGESTLSQTAKRPELKIQNRIFIVVLLLGEKVKGIGSATRCLPVQFERLRRQARTARGTQSGPIGEKSLHRPSS